MAWAEWDRFMDVPYRSTCEGLSIPPDVIEGMVDEAREQVGDGALSEAAATMETLFDWLWPTDQYPDRIAEIQGCQSMLVAGENPWAAE